jgi:hypothetical protein
MANPPLVLSETDLDERHHNRILLSREKVNRRPSTATTQDR